MMKHVLIEMTVFAILLIIAWIGFQITPKAFHQKNIPLDNDSIETATNLVTGIAHFHVNGIRMMGRFITYSKAEEETYRYFEVTWFGIPMISGYDLPVKDHFLIKWCDEASKTSWHDMKIKNE